MGREVHSSVRRLESGAGRPYDSFVFSAGTRLYLKSPLRLAPLQKPVEFLFAPRVGEWVKLRNAEMGNYFAIRIDEVTHVEGEGVDVKLAPLELEEEEFGLYLASYQAEGWNYIPHPRQMPH